MSRKRNIFCFWRGKVRRNSFPTGSYPKNMRLEITNAWLETWFAERSLHRNSAHTWSGKIVYLQMSVFTCRNEANNNKSNMILSKRMTWDLVSRTQLTFWQTGRKGNQGDIPYYTVWIEPWKPGLKFKLYAFAIFLFTFLVEVLLENVQGLRSLHVKTNMCDLIFMIPTCTNYPCVNWVLVWTQVSNYACIICLIRLHSLACQTKFVSIRIQVYNN